MSESVQDTETNGSPHSGTERSDDVQSKNDLADSNERNSDERIARIPFSCKSCGLNEMVHYYGNQPSFVFGVEFCEPTYIMRDPFQAPLPSWKSKGEYFVALGANCRSCSNAVCKDNACSVFYKQTYCIACATIDVSDFPSDVQQKIKKQLHSTKH